MPDPAPDRLTAADLIAVLEAAPTADILRLLGVELLTAPPKSPPKSPWKRDED